MKLTIGDRIAFVRRCCLQAGIVVAVTGTNRETQRAVVASTDDSNDDGIRREEIAVHPDYISKEAELEPSTRDTYRPTWEQIESFLKPS